jgi:hypothetical protein
LRQSCAFKIGIAEVNLKRLRVNFLLRLVVEFSSPALFWLFALFLFYYLSGIILIIVAIVLGTLIYGKTESHVTDHNSTSLTMTMSREGMVIAMGQKDMGITLVDSERMTSPL